MPWEEIHRRACTAEAEQNAHVLDVYKEANQQAIVGEWSLAVNHDKQLDLSDAETAKEMAKLYKEQVAVFRAHGAVRGAFFWTLRMGSGWDPRPTDTHPYGQQVEGTSAAKSIPGYPFQVWSLLEMDRYGIAAPLNEAYADVCA